MPGLELQDVHIFLVLESPKLDPVPKCGLASAEQGEGIPDLTVLAVVLLIQTGTWPALLPGHSADSCSTCMPTRAPESFPVKLISVSTQCRGSRLMWGYSIPDAGLYICLCQIA